MAEQKGINALGREAAYQLGPGIGNLPGEQGRGGGDAAGCIMQPGSVAR